MIGTPGLVATSDMDKVFAGEAVDVTMGCLNAIWQGDANAMALCALNHLNSPPLLINLAGFDDWMSRWRALGPDAGLMERTNPIYIPRNHLVEEALTAATAGDLGSLKQLLDAVTKPYDERPGLERYAAPAPEDFGSYRTFCGT